MSEEYGRPVDPSDFYGVPDAIARAIDALMMDDDPDPKVLRRLRMAFTAATDSEAAINAAIAAERERMLAGFRIILKQRIALALVSADALATGWPDTR